ncbi:DNA cytosine methyltransferase [Aquibacillus sediminis]|uniref:DNA cytosine methyltransferase n=1 Tax=Aquibacillus sediminis TaxID=2574734 RepID=UPI0011084A89|nr:DNA (cytosine-5-)-methyltransferase [Aquibacillus sediminis]
MKKKLNIATVFSGIGSVEYALKRMNVPHNIVFACDNGEVELEDIDDQEVWETIKEQENKQDKKQVVDDLYKNHTRKTNFVKKTYFANYNIDEEQWHHDIRFIDGTDYRGEVDLFVGGSPCQSFSIMGYQKGLDDARGTLFYDYARLVKEIQPKVFIFENVQGIRKHDKGNTWEIVSNVFNDLGYKIHSQILDAVDYGIPQKRRRIFIVGFKDETIDFEFPKPISNIDTIDHHMQDLLLNKIPFGKLNVKDNGMLNLAWNGEGERVDERHFLSEKVLKHVMSPGTKGYYTKPEIDLKIARPLLSTMHKMHRAGVDNYVTDPFVGKVRRLTPRECLRLMGYDDDFEQVVSDTQMYRQAGNSIVVDVFIHLLKQIDNYEKILPNDHERIEEHKKEAIV